MASRNFCDLCDTNIGQDQNYFTLTITHGNGSSRGWEQPTWIVAGEGTVPIAANDGMVCETCTLSILKLRNGLDKDRRA